MDATSLLQLAFDRIAVGACLTDARGIHVLVNATYAQWYGYQPKDMIGQSLAITAPPRKLDETWKAYMDFLATGSVAETDWESRHRDGSTLIIRALAQVIDLGSERYVLTTIRDVTRERELEAERRDIEARIRAVVDATSDFVWSIDTDRKVVMINHAMRERGKTDFGIDVQPGDDCVLLASRFPADYAEQFSGAYLRCLRGEAMVVTVDRDRHGVRQYLEVAFNPIVADDGSVTGAAMWAHDVTPRETEKRYLQDVVTALSKANADIGQYSYITSHQLRAPIANLSSLLSLYDDANPASVDNRDVVRHLRSSVTRLEQTLDDLSSVLAIRHHPPAVVTGLHRFDEVVQRAVVTLDGLVRRTGLDVTTDFKVDTIEYPGEHLETITVNMVSNALRFSRPGVRPHIHVATRATQHGTVLSFTDNGLGIDLGRHGSRLFGLYQKFHDVPDGKGLGLHICQALVRSLGGDIDVESEPGSGTTFSVRLAKPS